MAHPISKDELYGIKLKDVFQRDNNFERFRNLLSSEVSLRDYEWLVKDYAPKKKVSYEHKGRPFIVYHQFTQARTDARKKRFDPFARGKHIDFTPDADKWPAVSTTLGQLNFFVWAFENGIMEYMDVHHDDVHADRLANEKLKKLEPAADKTKRRGRMQAAKTISRHNVEILVKFDEDA